MNIFGYEIGQSRDHKLPMIPDTSIKLEARDEGPTIRPELKGVSIPDAKKPANVGMVRPTTLQYNADRNRRGDFVEPEYDLAQVGRIEDTDSYVHQAFLKKIGTVRLCGEMDWLERDWMQSGFRSMLFQRSPQ